MTVDEKWIPSQDLMDFVYRSSGKKRLADLIYA